MPENRRFPASCPLEPREDPKGWQLSTREVITHHRATTAYARYLLCIDAGPRNQGNGALKFQRAPRFAWLRGTITSSRQEMPTATHHHKSCCQIHCRGGFMCFVSTSCKLLPGRAHSHELCFSLHAIVRATGKTPAANTVVMIGPLLKRTGSPGLRVPNTPQTSHPCLQEFPEASRAAQTIPTNQLSWPAFRVCSLP